MSSTLLPPLWLIVLIVGLPQLSETVYTPSLPDIAYSLQTSASAVEYTLTIYLIGFAFGSLFWGRISDKFGRKPCVLIGLIIFIIGCVGCYFAPTIKILMISRLIQAFGGSIGSVLGQAICPDAFHGPSLGKVYSSTGSALALFPALGPIIGGVIAEYLKWSNIFLFLVLFALVLGVLVLTKLPETHHRDNRKILSSAKVAFSLIRDKKVIGFGIIVGGCNGILFSYFAEGSFYLIKGLGLSPSTYGSSFILIASATLIGGILSRKLHANHSSQEIMNRGLSITGIAATLFSVISLFHTIVYFSPYFMIIATLFSQMSIALGICMTTSNALALALVDYKGCIGTASSFFGFFYYCLISLFTLGMGWLHEGSLLVMPLYFLGISVFMIGIKRIMIPNK